MFPALRYLVRTAVKTVLARAAEATRDSEPPSGFFELELRERALLTNVENLFFPEPREVGCKKLQFWTRLAHRSARTLQTYTALHAGAARTRCAYYLCALEFFRARAGECTQELRC